MGAERWIVFLVLASLGGGVYIMTYFVDEESFERYGEKVAEYNAQHHETMMDAALHRAKRGPKVNGELSSDSHSGQVNDALTVDHSLLENDASLKEPSSLGRTKRSDHENGEIVSGLVTDRARSSNPQGIDEEDANDKHLRIVRARRSSGQGIDGEPTDAAGTQISWLGITQSSDLVNQNDAVFLRDFSAFDKDANLKELQKDYFPSVIADLYASSEDNDAREQQIPASSSVLLENSDVGLSSNGYDGFASKFMHSSEDSPGDADDSDTDENQNSPYNTMYFGNADGVVHLSRRLLSPDGDKKLITFNKGIDFILKLMNAMFSLEGEDSVPLPALNKTFGHGIMQGIFQASGGIFKNPATLHRTGDVAIVKNGDSVGLEVALGLETLAAGYSHYDLKILKIHQNGTLDVSIAENSIKMKISLTYYPHCKVDVNYLELDQLGGIKVDITGLGAFQSMFDMISKWLLDNFTNDFRKIVNKKLIENAKKAVARQDICEYFPLNLL